MRHHHAAQIVQRIGLRLAPVFRRILAQLEALGYGETDAFPNVVNFLSTSLTDLGELAALDSTLRGYIRPREAAYGEGRVPTLLAFLYARAKLAAEPGAAAAVGALLAGKVPDVEGKTVVAVVSGGNVAPQTAAAILSGNEA